MRFIQHQQWYGRDVALVLHLNFAIILQFWLQFYSFICKGRHNLPKFMKGMHKQCVYGCGRSDVQAKSNNFHTKHQQWKGNWQKENILCWLEFEETFKLFSSLACIFFAYKWVKFICPFLCRMKKIRNYFNFIQVMVGIQGNIEFFVRILLVFFGWYLARV